MSRSIHLRLLQLGPVAATSAIAADSLMPEKHQQDDDRDRYAEQPEKNGHFLFLHVLVIEPAIENLFRAAQRVQLSRQRCSGTITVFCTSRNTVAR